MNNFIIVEFCDGICNLLLLQALYKYNKSVLLKVQILN